MRSLNLLVRFLLELACLAALAFWGMSATERLAENLALTVILVGTTAVVWGRWAAPRAAHRLTGHRLGMLEAAFLASVCILLELAGATLAAGLLAAIALINAALLK